MTDTQSNSVLQVQDAGSPEREQSDVRLGLFFRSLDPFSPADQRYPWWLCIVSVAGMSGAAPLFGALVHSLWALNRGYRAKNAVMWDIQDRELWSILAVGGLITFALLLCFGRHTAYRRAAWFGIVALWCYLFISSEAVTR